MSNDCVIESLLENLTFVVDIIIKIGRQREPARKGEAQGAGELRVRAVPAEARGLPATHPRKLLNTAVSGWFVVLL